MLDFFVEKVNDFGLDSLGPKGLGEVPSNKSTHCDPKQCFHDYIPFLAARLAMESTVLRAWSTVMVSLT